MARCLYLQNDIFNLITKTIKVSHNGSGSIIAEFLLNCCLSVVHNGFSQIFFKVLLVEIES